MIPFHGSLESPKIIIYGCINDTNNMSPRIWKTDLAGRANSKSGTTL